MSVGKGYEMTTVYNADGTVSRNTQQKVAVIVGAPMEEQTVYGPFDCFDDADQWCCDNLKNGEWTWIITLYKPEELK